ncbi:MAG: hypothetical protein A2149_06140 [Candidatus Schekmanbacteria bacterium RBG_16_38_11]|uniref:Uncharacterized protein n=2 Tax=Candidatus Schekmaniibacteriota TaxID=1817811 RepID=A0A1F7RBQ7_9BACT|nr:MAG: hypothetical protein A2042_10080 [Candidatus Schekmanbacteria bacterium GWA2_38_11]OGL43882.1 MAG: hypothetical protein A2149_06140 [Candidatus Schekmanbacteria bacterium RBG_16_38_11]
MSVRFPHKKENKVKRVWPKGYKRFEIGSEEEIFEVKPQKYNFRLILLSLILVLILWFLVITPYLNHPLKKEGPIKIKIFNGDIPAYSNPKAK